MAVDTGAAGLSDIHEEGNFQQNFTLLHINGWFILGVANCMPWGSNSLQVFIPSSAGDFFLSTWRSVNQCAASLFGEKNNNLQIVGSWRHTIGQSWFALMRCDDYNSAKIQSVWPHSMSETRIEIDESWCFITELKLFEEVLVGPVLQRLVLTAQRSVTKTKVVYLR